MSRASHGGFTLLELLAVISIILVVMAFVTPAVNSMMGGSQLNAASQKVISALDFAHGSAVARNRSMEVRFYSYTDPNAPASNGAQYRALQIFEISETGTPTAVGSTVTLPTSTVMDSGTIPVLSTLLLNSGPVKSGASLGPIAQAGTNFQEISFRFLPGGGTNLAPTKQWYITVRNLNVPPVNNQAPVNYVAIQNDPISGATTVYRP